VIHDKKVGESSRLSLNIEQVQRRLVAPHAGLLFAAALIVVLICTYLVVRTGNVTLYQENGLLENLQAGLLVVCVIGFALRGIRAQSPRRWLLLLCALLSYAFLLREVDVERLGLPAIFGAIGAGVGRNASIAIALLALLGMLARNRVASYGAALTLLRSNSGRWLVATGALLVLGAWFDKHPTYLHARFIEESFELLAFVCMLNGALADEA
jgi:hypothetical protein